MAAINTSQELARVRSQIDAQQQVVSMLELRLQELLLGSSATTKADLLSSVSGIYSSIPNGAALTTAFTSGTANFPAGAADQTLVRNMLYQAKAMLGELRVEEQQWNTEVNEEKARRKDLTDFAKG